MAFSSISKPLIAFFMLTIFISSSSTLQASLDHHHNTLGWVPSGSAAALSSNADLEFEFESEISRRILASSRYISYGALQRNSVPCSRRGASYYNCRNGAQANPYNRGCSAITRCRR